METQAKKLPVKHVEGYRFIDGKGEHRHEYDGDPMYGTTTVINEMYPPPLAWWGSGKALEALGWRNPKKTTPDEVEKALVEGQAVIQRIAHVDMAEYKAFLDSCYRAHDREKNAKGKIGKDVHKIIETYIKECVSAGVTLDLRVKYPEIEPFINWALKDVYGFLWSEGFCYSTRLWVGGQSDFGFIHKNGMVFVGDNKPSIYPKNFIQTAGYGIQVKENGLFNADGSVLLPHNPHQKIDGYLIFDYNTGDWRYRTDVATLELYFEHTVELYKHKDIVGTKDLLTKSI